MSRLSDQAARDRALDPAGSFIVQAPAGSGKTELLSLRFLNLLSNCQEPEEVLAITFTRKAASEMKDRIIRALRDAQADDEGRQREALDEIRFQIARAALRADASYNWQILANPARLKIQTIDSFCLGLATRIPLLSRVGGTPNVSDDVEQCFAEAIVNTLEQLNRDSALSADIARLLHHLDNDIGRVEQLLFRLLGNRDQWLPHVLDIHSASQIDREYLRRALRELIEEALQELRDALLPYADELVTLLNHAASHLPPEQPAALTEFVPLTALPAADAGSLPCWRLLESILLTRTNASWRATITKREGFPADIKGDREQTRLCKQRKQQWSALLEQLSGQDQLREEIAYLRLLPDPTLEDDQWDFLTTLARILTYLSSQLLLSFQRLHVVDHAQVAAAALTALGTDDQPTDLALVLDHRIHHILVDEFQDTSKLQTDLLKKLTAGWQPDDGRTLFLVGDAMQSVYGFRNANVGIYLSVQQEGLGDLPLEPLTLTSNFRSQAHVVEWVNRIFASTFPARPIPARGAVPYTPSVPSRPPLSGLGVTTGFISADPAAKEQARQWEAQQIALRVTTLKCEDPSASVAILVRSRSHLRELIPALRRAGLSWQATDIDKMASLPVIDDLQSLTRAVLNLGDRIAWLSILRAPWCGLSLADLHTLALTSGDGSIWASLEDYPQISALSPDGRERLRDFVPLMAFAIRARFQCRLRRLIEALWTLLGGAALANGEAEQASVAHYLNMLEEEESAGTLPDWPAFARRVHEAYVPSRARTNTDSAVHLLTMHKAKGLEYDHVILPCLGAESQADEKPLLQWYERVNRLGEPRLFLAALSAAGAGDDPLYRLIRYEQSRKSRYEDVRLLYIAVTRARKSAHLTATLSRNAAGEASPSRGSLLRYIWPQLTGQGRSLDIQALESLPADGPVTPPGDDLPQDARATPYLRFVQPMALTTRERSLLFRTIAAETEEASSPPAAERADVTHAEAAAAVGTLIHQALETLVNHPQAFLCEESRENLKVYWRRQLAGLITDQSAIADAVTRIEGTLQRCLDDAGCAWVLDAGLRESATELPVSSGLDDRTHHYVIDRTFVDDGGTRWVLDYKTAVPDHGMSEEVFIAQQVALHRPQLARYRSLFEELEERPVRTALLLTALPRLIEIS